MSEAVAPRISVVTAVYNGDAYLCESLESILNQDDLSFELIVVNDGSSDGTGRILDGLASNDHRIRLIHQQNQGLTMALRRGCAEARGDFIVRHDAGDLSLPGRLKAQSDFIQCHPEAAIVSCWTQKIGPEGELLGDVAPTLLSSDATAKLRSRDLRELAGPSHHGSVLFRRSDYEQVGGYRPCFYFAQDFDLWCRLSELGELAFLPHYFYQTRYTEECISTKYRSEQLELARLAILCTDARANGHDEQPILELARRIRPGRHGSRSDENAKALGNYWIGRMLQGRKDERAFFYLRRAIELRPSLIRARVALLLGRMGLM